MAAAMRGPPARHANERALSWVNWELRSAVGTESAKRASVLESQAAERPHRTPAAQKRWYLPWLARMPADVSITAARSRKAESFATMCRAVLSDKIPTGRARAAVDSPTRPWTNPTACTPEHSDTGPDI